MSIKDLFANTELVKQSDVSFEMPEKNGFEIENVISQNNINPHLDIEEVSIPTLDVEETSNNSDILDNYSDKGIIEENVSTITLPIEVVKKLQVGVNKVAKYIKSISEAEKNIINAGEELKHFKKAGLVADALVNNGYITEEERNDKISELIKLDEKDLPNLIEFSKIGKIISSIGDADYDRTENLNATEQFINDIMS